MYLKKIKLSNFKNYEEASLSFSGKINCFIGDNGVGKTNLLDAVYYLSFCKSYFNPVDSQNIRHGEDFFAIHGTYLKNHEQKDDLSCTLKAGQKKIFRMNAKPYERLADHIGLFPLVMISPYDRDLINEGSEVRRRYIDAVISQFDRLYLDDLISYNRVLLHRNALLKKMLERGGHFDPESLEIWDAQLAPLGQKIHERRKAFIKSFIPIFRKHYEFITDGKEEVDIRYQSQLNETPLEDLLAVTVARDRDLRYTSAGIHKDDLIFNISGHPIKKFGSQGQQKSFVIAIKLAQFDYTRDLKGYTPVLLLDDIFDKLDDDRVKKIIEMVGRNNFGQVFITDTQKHRAERIFKAVDIDHKIFQVTDGKIEHHENQ